MDYIFLLPCRSLLRRFPVKTSLHNQQILLWQDSLDSCEALMRVSRVFGVLQKGIILKFVRKFGVHCKYHALSIDVKKESLREGSLAVTLSYCYIVLNSVIMRIRAGEWAMIFGG